MTPIQNADNIVKSITILAGIGLVVGVGVMVSKKMNDIKATTVHNKAAGDVLDPNFLAIELQEYLNVGWLDWNAEEEKVVAILEKIETKTRFAQVSAAYRKLTGNQLIDDLRNVGSDDYQTLILPILNRLK